MDALKHEKCNDYQMTALEVFVSFMVGVFAVGIIWLFTGLLIGLFFL